MGFVMLGIREFGNIFNCIVEDFGGFLMRVLIICVRGCFVICIYIWFENFVVSRGN